MLSVVWVYYIIDSRVEGHSTIYDYIHAGVSYGSWAVRNVVFEYDARIAVAVARTLDHTHPFHQIIILLC